jgi:DNA invertase Pin-like site-specific DNA recombinase
MDYISYLRVSTKRQGISGLGIEGQRQMIERSLSPDDNLIEEYIEIESGSRKKQKNRVHLMKAIEQCQATGATLLIAKLDRLSRDVQFLFEVKNSGINIKALDVPELNTLTLGIFASVAEYEREKISERTTAALQAKKKRGERLGNPDNLTSAGRAKAWSVKHDLAKERDQNKAAYRMIRELKKLGYSLRAIARELNANGFKTVKNKKFHASTVKHISDMYVTA